MDEQKKPRARVKKVVQEGKAVEKKGEGLGTGPVNNTGNYEERRQQEAARREQSQQRPVSGMFGQTSGSAQNPSGQQKPGQSFFGHQQRPGQSFFGQQRPSQSSYGQTGERPQQTAYGQTQQRPGQSSFGQNQRPRPGSYTQKPSGYGTQSNSSEQRRSSSTVQRSGSGTQRSGGGGKLILILAVLALIFGGGKLGGLFGGDEQGESLLTGNTGSVISQSSDTGSSAGNIGNLLSSFLGSGSSSAYDLPGSLSSLFGGSSGNDLSSLIGGGNVSQSESNTSSFFGGGNTTQSSGGLLNHYFTSSSGNGASDTEPDSSVVQGARNKRTVIRGNGKDTVTLMVYMCGTDLESQNGMGTADLKEMTKASLSDNINLIVYTGGCRRWRNNVISSSVNQIYQIKNGGLYCLEDNMGSGSMTKAETLTSFLQYGAKHFSADRMCLIFWDHGGGSVSGFGYDEKYGSGTSMTLAGINTALKNSGVVFDFIGFDSCLMGTVENGIMLSQYADYMIASEETEPGVGWYYTNWLNKLSKNTSMPTIEIGKMIADDYVAVCEQQCRGQATTLSVVDLAELEATVPRELTDFSRETSEMIAGKQYSQVSKARSNTKEFAQSTRIDQVDLIHFARNMKTKEGKELAAALEGAIKYNRTGGGISNANGLSIYFPYKRANKVSQAVATYEQIGMNDEYARCIQEFASLEVSGQVAAGTPVQSYGSQSVGMPSLMSSLLGNGSYSSSAGSQDMMGSLLNGLFSGSGSGDVLGFFSGRSLTAESAAEYILENHFDPAQLVWVDGKISLAQSQWDMIDSVLLNVFVDDGNGFIDLGTDNVMNIVGNDLPAEYDGTWLSIDRQPIAYYYLNTVEDGDDYAITGYTPALLNGVPVNLILIFDSERPDGYIAGARQVYKGGETDTAAKNLIAIGAGDKLQFLCDYYDYNGIYQDSYKLGDPITLGNDPEIANIPVRGGSTKATVCFTDIYQQQYWTPEIP